MSQIILEHPFLYHILFYLANDNDGLFAFSELVETLIWFCHIWGGCSRGCVLDLLPYHILEKSIVWLLCTRIEISLDCRQLYAIGNFITIYNRTPSTVPDLDHFLNYTPIGG